MKRIDWHSPMTVMAVAIAMYVVKVAIKVPLGNAVHSPVLVGDGVHNLGDIVAALVVVSAVWIARLPPTPEYHFGRRNVESVIKGMTGLGLLAMALHTFARVAAAAVAAFPGIAAALPFAIPLPEHEAVVIDMANFPWVLLATGGSFAASMVVGRYQIREGRASGHGSVVADGKETLSDARIEIVACVGMMGEYLAHAAWIEYPLALIVAALIARTGLEILEEARDGILLRSIGSEHEEGIRKSLQTLHGVIDVVDVKTFRVGSAVHVSLKILTRCSTAQQEFLKRAALAQLAVYLEGTVEATAHARYIRFEAPRAVTVREAYAMVVRGHDAIVARSLATATHLRICDVTDGDIVRWEEVSKPASVEDLIALLTTKRVRAVFVFGTELDIGPVLDAQDCRVAESGSFAISFASSCTPENLGM